MMSGGSRTTHYRIHDDRWIAIQLNTIVGWSVDRNPTPGMRSLIGGSRSHCVHQHATRWTAIQFGPCVRRAVDHDPTPHTLTCRLVDRDPTLSTCMTIEMSRCNSARTLVDIWIAIQICPYTHRSVNHGPHLQSPMWTFGSRSKSGHGHVGR